MGLSYPVVNGHLYSFASVEVKIGDFTYLGVTEVNYSESVEPVAVYGSDPVRVGRTLGRRKLTADLQILRREWDFLLAQVGANFGRRKVEINVQYAEEAQPVMGDFIEGYIQQVDSSNREGNEASTVKVTLDPTEVKWRASGFDAVSMEGAPTATDAAFWIQTEDGIEGPDYASNAWDTVKVGGVPLPGICSVKGLPTLAFEKKKAGGVDGAAITVNGYLPGPIDIECRMWTPSQWRLFQNEVAPKIWTRPNSGKVNPATLAKDVVHPAFAVWGIRSVVVLGVSVIEPAGEPGIRVIKIKCVEYVPTVDKPKTKTAKGSTNVPTDRHFQPASNRAGEPPSKTGIHIGGQPVSHKGGVS